jgi:hypothetical protein
MSTDMPNPRWSYESNDGSSSYAEWGETRNGRLELVVFDGAEGAGIVVPVDDLLELAFIIYEEYG